MTFVKKCNNFDRAKMMLPCKKIIMIVKATFEATNDFSFTRMHARRVARNAERNVLIVQL